MLFISILLKCLVGLQYVCCFHVCKQYSQRRNLIVPRIVTDITSCEQLDDIIDKNKEKLIIVDYSTTWCGPCKLMAPKFQLLSEKHGEAAIFLKCTGDASDSTALLMKREGVRSVPAFHLWKNTERIEVIIGAQLRELEANIDQLK